MALWPRERIRNERQSPVSSWSDQKQRQYLIVYLELQGMTVDLLIQTRYNPPRYRSDHICYQHLTLQPINTIYTSPLLPRYTIQYYASLSSTTRLDTPQALWTPAFYSRAHSTPRANYITEIVSAKQPAYSSLLQSLDFRPNLPSEKLLEPPSSGLNPLLSQYRYCNLHLRILFKHQINRSQPAGLLFYNAPPI